MASQIKTIPATLALSLFMTGFALLSPQQAKGQVQGVLDTTSPGCSVGAPCFAYNFMGSPDIPSAASYDIEAPGGAFTLTVSAFSDGDAAGNANAFYRDGDGTIAVGVNTATGLLNDNPAGLGVNTGQVNPVEALSFTFSGPGVTSVKILAIEFDNQVVNGVHYRVDGVLIGQLTGGDSGGGPSDGLSLVDDVMNTSFDVAAINGPPTKAQFRIGGLLLQPTLPPSPELTLTKSALTELYDEVGDVLSYQYVVANTGNVPLDGPVTVSDDNVDADPVCPDVDTVGNNNDVLDPGEQLTCTASYTVDAGDLENGSVTNHATASADGVDSNEDTATVIGLPPGVGGDAEPLSSGDITCEVGAGNPRIRAEGVTEIVGDIILTCINVTSPNPVYVVDGLTNPIVEANISVIFPEHQVSNNINFESYPDSGELADAVLIIQDNHCDHPQQISTRSEADCEYADDATASEMQPPWPQYGVIADEFDNYNRIVWTDVRLPVPGAFIYESEDANEDGSPAEDNDIIGQNPGVIRARISGIRVNVAGRVETVFTNLHVESSGVLTTTKNIQIDTAQPRQTLFWEAEAAGADLRCDPDPQETVYGGVVLEEGGFPAPFRPLGYPSFDGRDDESEMAYFSPGSNGRTGDPDWDDLGGGASQGTQFELSFVNIPTGVKIKVPKVVQKNGLVLQVVPIDYEDGPLSPGFDCEDTDQDSDVDGDDDAVPFAGQLCGAYTSVSLSSGAGSVTYEVGAADGTDREDIGIPVQFDVAGADVDDSGSTVGQVAVSYAPVSEVGVASEDDPEPRFETISDGGEAPQDIISLAGRICGTTLLFPFVTAQSGFDTGIAISNTSEDWLGTTPQDGACTIHYIGEGEGGADPDPMDETSDVIDGGDQLIFTLSAGNASRNIVGNPAFQGYIIAQCDFQHAHGFAFITDGFGGIPSLAQGYLALVIPMIETDEGSSVRLPGVPGLHNLGETLFH